MKKLTPKQTDFVEAQPMFFVATAAADGRVNVSPKGMDTLRVVDPQRIVWLNLSGSGNETAAHVESNGRMTLMFMSITDQPLILRLYGTAQVIHPRQESWNEMVAMFPTLGGSRQIFDLRIEETATSCGTGVPIMTVDAVRADTEMEPFYAAMTSEEMHDYWSRKNVESIDGFPTRIFDDA